LEAVAVESLSGDKVFRKVSSMTIEIPEHDLGAAQLSPSEAKLDFAVGLYTGRHLSMGKAAKLAGISYTSFLHELGRRGISVNYGEKDLLHDLNVLDAARAKRADDRRK
jgi:predicted HTH domain antitoxin